ncbi:MAG TPA: hypothetical protein VGR16_12715 [Thermomicrobiales bacterium]|nr:hypothetical protein [Thermomicrobiales bacterium]
MKVLLTRLTLGLVAVIVVVLAGYLVLIALSLLRANRNLDKLAGGLEAVRDNTASLGSDISAINAAAATLNDGLSRIGSHLKGVNQSLKA